jgi:rhodanese-related sulfurtransferase
MKKSLPYEKMEDSFFVRDIMNYSCLFLRRTFSSRLGISEADLLVSINRSTRLRFSLWRKFLLTEISYAFMIYIYPLYRGGNHKAHQVRITGGRVMFSFFSKSQSNSVRVNDLDSILKSISLIDIREPQEYKSGHLPTAKNIPMNTILMAPENHLDESKEYHIICHSGARSSRACQILSSKGYKVVDVAGGTGSYRGQLER